MGTKECVAILVVGIALAYTYLSQYTPKAAKIAQHVDDVYDYVIVGGGSAGSVVASRLSEDKDMKVLLLEAGGNYDENPWFDIPSKWLDLENTDHDWAYYTEPQKVSNLGLKERRAFWPRGRVLGGSSVLNAMQYTRGSPHEYDEWSANGCTGWSFKEVLPYFLKSEDIQIDTLKPSKYHSSGGPLAVSGGEVTPLAGLYMQAGQEMGYNITDYNGADQEGFSKIQVTVRKGVRSATGREFLGPVSDRENLHIATRAFATKLDIKDKRASGVYYIRNGRKHLVKARREVIVSAGAINSPQLLMLSGIGPKKHLNDLGIPVVADLPVGENLHDHQMVCMFNSINEPYSFTSDAKNSFMGKMKYALFGSGPNSLGGADGSAFLHLDKSKVGKTYPDIQFILFSVLFDTDFFNFKDDIAKEYLEVNKNVHGFTTVVSLTHPRSRGRITLRSRDPFDYPLLDPQYLTNQKDVDDFIGGIRLWEKFAETDAMKKLGVDVNQMKLSICSQHKFRSDAYWECIVRHLAITVYHHTCTCKMGAENDTSAVVEPKLRVKGIEGLRVVDASVFPKVTSGNTNAPTIMIAEKASDLIRGKDTVKHLRSRKLP